MRSRHSAHRAFIRMHRLPNELSFLLCMSVLCPHMLAGLLQQHQLLSSWTACSRWSPHATQRPPPPPHCLGTRAGRGLRARCVMVMYDIVTRASTFARRQQQGEGGEGRQGGQERRLQEAAQAAVLRRLSQAKDAEEGPGPEVPTHQVRRRSAALSQHCLSMCWRRAFQDNHGGV